jgi:hypothetical protein
VRCRPLDGVGEGRFGKARADNRPRPADRDQPAGAGEQATHHRERNELDEAAEAEAAEEIGGDADHERRQGNGRHHRRRDGVGRRCGNARGNRRHDHGKRGGGDAVGGGDDARVGAHQRRQQRRDAAREQRHADAEGRHRLGDAGKQEAAVADRLDDGQDPADHADGEAAREPGLGLLGLRPV